MGETPLESNILIRTSGYTPFAKLHIMQEHCCKIKIFCTFTDNLPTRFITFTKNEWVSAHSKCKLLLKRVGAGPLEVQTFTKTSGPQPTRIKHFDPNEWVYSLRKITYNVNKCDKMAFFSVEVEILPHLNLCFNVKRVGRDPLIS